MYVCICLCIHVNVCHVYMVCHLQELAAAVKRRSLPLDHPSQFGPPFEIPSPSDPLVLQPRFPPRIVRHETEESVKTKTSLGENRFFGGKNRNFEPKGVFCGPIPPQEGHCGRGREWECHDSPLKYSRNYGKCVCCFVLLLTDIG